MIKRIISTLLILAAVNVLYAQQSQLSKLLQELNSTQNDTIKLVQLRTISRFYAEIDPDSAYHYAEKTLHFSRLLQFRLDEASALREMGYAHINRGNYPRALQSLLSALSILEDAQIESLVLVGDFVGDDELHFRTASPQAQRLSELAFAHQILGVLYANSNNYQKSWHHHLLGRQAANQSGNTIMQSILNLTLNRVYLNLNKPDSALIAIEQAYEQVIRSGYKRYLGSYLLNIGRTHAALGNIALANEFYRKSLVASEELGYYRGVVASSLLLANSYTLTRNIDSAFSYINHALVVAQNMDAPELLLRSYTALTQHYRAIGNNDSLAKYQTYIININDSLFNAKQVQQFQNIDFDEQLRIQQLEEERKKIKNRITQNSLLVGLSVLILIAMILFRNNKQKQKANLTLESTLLNLKSTQAQLIQSEKMASLGELTAGIAHEIKNPLNFVNNFSEVSIEMIEEAIEERSKSQESRDETLVDEILEDIRSNLQKVHEHGTRANGIVSSMLQHSRGGSGIMEPTDLNALVKEYVNLSFHGMRAGKNPINVDFDFQLGKEVGMVNLVSEDFSRVIVNLCNNAFDAMRMKTLQGFETLGGLEQYQPQLTIRTKSEKNQVIIEVEDNGPGIPEEIQDKILQPFFTTKKGTEGTGLGLSITHDIIKAHNGVLDITSKVGEWTKFSIRIPKQA